MPANPAQNPPRRPRWARAMALCLWGALASGPALGQDKTDHAGHGTDASAETAPMPWAAPYSAANARMHQGMDIAYSDNPDVDFARAMIAHHQGAIDMAMIQLQFGTDPAMRALAEAIIAAQGPEIEQMRAFIAKSGG